jgi:hypothetical protein
VPLGVTTRTVPVVAFLGTVVVISEFEATLKTAAVPLNVTLVAPVKVVPIAALGQPSPANPAIRAVRLEHQL